jgi:hypothetical protein
MKKILVFIFAGISSINAATVEQSYEPSFISSSLDQQTKDAISKKLRDYRVTGVSCCIDPNLALIYDNQNPQFVMSFQNSKGEIKTRAYQANITSVGLKVECSIKIDFIMFVNTDLNFEDSSKELELGMGIDISIGLGGGLGLTYAPFTNTNGGILILSFLPNIIAINPFSLVLGGSLKPL